MNLTRVMDPIIQELEKEIQALETSVDFNRKQIAGIEKSIVTKQERLTRQRYLLQQMQVRPNPQVANATPAQALGAPKALESGKETPPRPSWAAMLAKADAQNTQTGEANA